MISNTKPDTMKKYETMRTANIANGPIWGTVGSRFNFGQATNLNGKYKAEFLSFTIVVFVFVFVYFRFINKIIE